MNDRSDEDLIADIRCLIVAADKPISISTVQAQLRIGYNRAARLLEAAQASAGAADSETADSDTDLGTHVDDPSTTVTEDPDGGPAWGTEAHAATFMLGRLMDVAKRRFTTLAEPWSKLSQREQESVLARLRDDIETEVKHAVKIIAANARITFRAEVESVQFKGPTDVKAALKLVNSPETHALADVAGGFVTVVIERDDELLALPEEALKGEPDNRTLFDESTEGTAVDTRDEEPAGAAA